MKTADIIAPMSYRVVCLAFLALLSVAMPAVAQVGAPLVGLDRAT